VTQTNALTWRDFTRPDHDWLDGLTAVEYFERHIEPGGDFGCWMWTGRFGNGYGSINVAGSSHTAYRVSYLMHRGAVPPGLVLDHLCRQPPCVNPWHLEPVTSAVNVRRANGFRSSSWRRMRRLQVA
jgi:hypothetical protein